MRKVIILLVIVVLGVVALVSAQQQDVPAPPTDRLLLEVRALRAEIKQSVGVNFQAGVLVGRLAVQNQRVGQANALVSMLQSQRVMNRQSRAQMEAAFTAMPQAPPNAKAQLDAMTKQDDQLKEQEEAAKVAANTERLAWDDLNARLDRLGYLLPK